MSSWLRRRSVEVPQADASTTQLRRTLSWPHLIALGIGAIVGTGIYTLIGVGAGLAGPGVLLSFAIAGAICACTALAYSELATMIPASGSAYTYSYVVLGESIAWVVGWSLILEYSLVVSTVAVGWSGYAVGFLEGYGVHLPHALVAGPHAGGIVNLPAVFITFVAAGLLVLGTQVSATLNALLVVVKMIALLVFVVIALPRFDAALLHPFMPHGFFKTVDAAGNGHGVMAAASIIFFAFYGFDAISTAAEETRKPERDLTIGIIGSMAGCTLIYVLVALAAIGALSYSEVAASSEPLAHVLRALGHPGAASLIAAAAVIALPTVLLAFLYGQTRIFFVMARDGLIPARLAKVNRKTGTPVTVTLATAVLIALLAGIFPLDEIAALANAGTLLAFVAVGSCVMVLRKRSPDAKRIFRMPAVWLLAPLGVLGCLYLFTSLPHTTQLSFLVWNVIGVVVYLAYGRRHSRLASDPKAL